MQLTDEAQNLFDAVSREYAISDAAGLHLLKTAAEAYTRMQHCQDSIAEHGESVMDRYQQIKPHPLLSAERDNRAAMLAALKALQLDLEPLRDIGRPVGVA